MAELRKCIGSTRFGIEPHEASVQEFPKQPSQKDGLGRMCKTHWNQYTSALRKAALARKAAESGGARRAGARPGADQGAHQARTQADHAGGRVAGRRRIAPPQPRDRWALGASPGPFSVRSRRWPRSGSPGHSGAPAPVDQPASARRRARGPLGLGGPAPSPARSYRTFGNDRSGTVGTLKKRQWRTQWTNSLRAEMV
jgi:hypothetical protein